MDLNHVLNLVIAVGTIASAIVATNTLIQSFWQRAEISMSYAALEDRTMPNLNVYACDETGSRHEKGKLNHVAFYAVISIRNTGNRRITLNEVLCAEKKHF